MKKKSMLPVGSDKKKSGKKSGKKKISLWVKRAFIFAFSLVMIFSITSVIVVGYVTNYIVSYSNGELAIDLEDHKLDQSLTSFIYAYDKNGKEVEYARLHGEENRVWVNLDQMGEFLPKVFVSLEDKRFYEHAGVDWYRFMSVFVKYNFSQGGSTITQQLIKNLTLEKDVTAVRKFREIVTALNLEKNYSKESILEAYMNTLYLGNSCYGVQTAAETYFGKNVDELNLAEAASIAAITQAPFTYDPLYNPENNKRRQEYCLDQMLEQGVISQQDHDQAVDFKLIYTNSPEYIPVQKEDETPVVEKKNDFQSYYVDYVIDSVIADLRSKLGLTLQQATNKIYYGGLKIYAAVDLDVQKNLEDVYYNRITFPKQEDTPEKPAVQSSMAILDYEGRIVGIIGGAGEKKANRSLNRAADSPRQPGSSIKPLAVYTPAIESNRINWSTMILNYGFPYGNLKMWPRNVDRSFGSNTPVTVQYALQESLNTVSARVVVDIVTAPQSMRFLQEKFHISTVDPVNDSNPAPMAVGAMSKGITSLEMAAAYAVFGSGGKYYKPYAYYKVTDRNGREVLLENNPQGEQVINPATADVMCELLQTVSTSSFGKGNNVRKFQIMAKTGTTDQDKDRWIAGGTPHYVAAVWYGYDKPKDIKEFPNPAGRVFIEVFDRIHKDLEPKKFEKSGLTVQKKYCASSGLLASDRCASTKLGWYKINALPAVCTDCSKPLIEEIYDSFGNLINQIIGNETTKPNNPVTTAPPSTTTPQETTKPPDPTLPPTTTKPPTTAPPGTTKPPTSTYHNEDNG